MKKVIRLTESDLKKIIEKVLLKEDEKEDAKIQAVAATACGTTNGIINAGTYKGKSFCDYYVPLYKITPEQLGRADDIVAKKCPNIITKVVTPVQGWNEIYNYFKSGTDGAKLKGGIHQNLCGNYFIFEGETPQFESLTIYSDGDLYFRRRGANKTHFSNWKWENNKPDFGVSQVTKNAVGYAQTEEEITSGKKILGVGSRGDLVKRVQYEILSDTDGKTNTGCKKDTDGNFKPALCDGIYGPKTKSAVIDFQKREALKDKSGIVGGETWQVMNPFPIDYEGYNFDS